MNNIKTYQRYAIHIGVMTDDRTDTDRYYINHRFVGVVDGWARFQNMVTGRIAKVSEHCARYQIYE